MRQDKMRQDKMRQDKIHFILSQITISLILAHHCIIYNTKILIVLHKLVCMLSSNKVPPLSAICLSLICLIHFEDFNLSINVEVSKCCQILLTLSKIYSKKYQKMGKLYQILTPPYKNMGTDFVKLIFRQGQDQ